MAKKTEKKTNAMRLLDGEGIPYKVLTYECDGVHFDGELVAQQVGLSPCRVFKTLVTKGQGREIVVCCIPVHCHLDLKALAFMADCKRLELAPLTELAALTGYVRGGVSPVAMKKSYPIFVDRSALNQETIAVSAGVRGKQLLIDPQALIDLLGGRCGDFAVGQENG